MDDKENFAPVSPRHSSHKDSSSPLKRATRKGRSKSIGPGGVEDVDAHRFDAKNRRRSAFAPVMKGILPSQQDAERKAARRKSMANRRVSFAPEATMHTWDVIEYMGEHTTSTESSESTRRASSIARQSPRPNSESEEPASTPPDATDHENAQDERRASVLDTPDDAYSSSGSSGGSDATDSEGEDGQEDEEGDDDATGTAMSLDTSEDTMQSVAESEASSTSSSARLERNLRAAAQMAGTRGIEFDEHGEMSMELADEEVTNAFRPWTEENVQHKGISATLDQENVNPFSPAFSAHVVTGTLLPPSVAEDDKEEEDMSMDVTRAVGGILRGQASDTTSSSLGEETMELTQAVGKIQAGALSGGLELRNGQKRRRSTSEAGSPGVTAPAAHPKRRRSSIARSSMGEQEMDLTVVIGGIQVKSSPVKQERRILLRRRSSAVAEQTDATMGLTRQAGRADTPKRLSGDSFDGNEELSMELTTVIGSIKELVNDEDQRPKTPQEAQSPSETNTATTPKDQERFKEVDDSSSRMLLTPVLQEQVDGSNMASSTSSRSSFPATRASPVIQKQADSPVQTRSAARIAAIKSSGSSGRSSPLRNVVSSSDLPPDEQEPSLRESTPSRTPQIRTPRISSTLREQMDTQSLPAEPSPSVEKQLRNTPIHRVSSTPQKARTPPSTSKSARTLVDSIKLMSTPRKEVLKSLTPKKQTPVQPLSAAKRMLPSARPTPKSRGAMHTSPARQLRDDLARAKPDLEPRPKVHLQQFLDEAGIRFMDLTTTKRRLTVAPTPSRNRVLHGEQRSQDQDETEVTLESAIIAAACTEPELELFKHACHELKRYIDEGKIDIKQLEAETYRETPPLVQAYMTADQERRAVIDAQMRDIKTNARLRSKEVWYGWRSNLLGDLMHVLQGIAEGLLKDDDLLQQKEQILADVLPGLIEERASLDAEAERLKQAVSTDSQEQREILGAARERLVAVDSELQEKRQLLQQLQQENMDRESHAEDLRETRDEFIGAIEEADRVREACRATSVDEIEASKASVKKLEETHGWKITSASADPATVTMDYKSQLQLFFHPSAFTTTDVTHNAPIGLRYTGTAQALPTTLRFFLQLLRASLHALPQCSTRIADMLRLVSSGWDMALAVAESERRLSIEGPADARILGDDRLSFAASVLLPGVRTKICATFALTISIGEALLLDASVEADVKVVYGEPYNEKNMTEFLKGRVDNGIVGWAAAVRELREKLVATGPKTRKNDA